MTTAQGWVRVLVLVASAGAAQADITANFESPPYNGAPDGILASGQEGWYQPVAGGTDQFVYTYEGNVLGFVQNPSGGTQFLAGVSQGGVVLPRAQHTHDFSAGGAWTASWDIAVQYLGTLPSAPNLGSFSMQPTGNCVQWQTLYNWVDVNTCTNWNCAFLPFDEFGVQAAQPGPTPDPAFENLLPNHWYHVSVTWNFATNLIESVSIQDTSSDTTTTVRPTGWYLTGGASPTLPLPTDVRHFAGGGIGNAVAIDNFTVTPAGGSPPCDPDLNQDGNADQDDVRYLVNVVGGGDNPTGIDPDFNHDGNADQSDIADLINTIGGGPCP